ncbi:MAG: hypothetical protein LBE31_07290, partial [Deltaproteobacteria bacterium]|nr:hypothetical protein [Deltaproteobacteria bacterium]
WTDKYGNKRDKINKKEFMPFIGDYEEFAKLFFYTSVRNGYGKYGNVVLLSDGATWIRHMKDKYYPDVQQILDFFQLKTHIS